MLTFDFSLHPVLNERHQVIYLVAEGRNITERKEAELRDAFLVGLDDATRPLTEAQEIIQTAARLLGEHLRVNRCAYADVEPDQNTFNLLGDYHPGRAQHSGPLFLRTVWRGIIAPRARRKSLCRRRCPDGSARRYRNRFLPAAYRLAPPFAPHC